MAAPRSHTPISHLTPGCPSYFSLQFAACLAKSVRQLFKMRRMGDLEKKRTPGLSDHQASTVFSKFHSVDGQLKYASVLV